MNSKYLHDSQQLLEATIEREGRWDKEQARLDLRMMGIGLHQGGTSSSIDTLALWPKLAEVKTLILRSNPIGDEGMRLLSCSPYLKELTALDVASAHLSEIGARAVASFARLQDLDISDNPIGDEGAYALTSLGKLQTLKMNACHLGYRTGPRPGALVKLLAALGITSKGNKGAPTPQERLGRALGAMPKLRVLALNVNSLTAQAIEQLVQAQLDQEAAAADEGDGATLRVLKLAMNRLGDRGARAVAKLALEGLDLSANEITDQGAATLASGQKLSALVSLGLDANPIGEAGALALASSMTLPEAIKARWRR